MSDSLAKISKLIELDQEGLIPKLEKHEVNPGLDKNSRLNYLYFTLPVALNFQRSSPAMWTSALKTYDDKETNYLFYPEEVIKTSYEKVQNDLIKHSLGLQKNKHTQIWYTLSKTLYENYEGNPYKLFELNNFDVTKIKSHVLENKKAFPYLSGPKMLNYWLFILSKFTEIEFGNIHAISIIPDTHIKQASKVLGVIDSDDPLAVEKAWFQLLSDSGINPVQLHPILWNWSRNNFKPEV